jgi:hypothetical protein
MNTKDIKDIMNKIEDTAPAGSKIEWQYPGYVSIVLSNGIEIAFGESLSSDTGYTWNTFELDGTNGPADSIEDLKDINLIVSTLWAQTKEIIPMRCDICQTSESLLTEAEKASLRPNWAGIDFYNSICKECWNKQEEIR